MTPAWSETAVRAALNLESPPGRSPVMFSHISTDSRSISAGALFIALSGERFDGHDHLTAAQLAGATGAVVRRGTNPVPGLQLFEVPDTLTAFGQLARARRR